MLALIISASLANNKKDALFMADIVGNNGKTSKIISIRLCVRQLIEGGGGDGGGGITEVHVCVTVDLIYCVCP